MKIKIEKIEDRTILIAELDGGFIFLDSIESLYRCDVYKGEYSYEIGARSKSGRDYFLVGFNTALEADNELKALFEKLRWK